jgi:hypothetical protein
LIVFNDTGDPIGRLTEYLDALDDHIQAVDGELHREVDNRLTLLHLHAFAGMLIAPSFAAIGRDGMTAPIWSIVRQIPGAPYSLAALMFTGAVILGIATTYRNLRWETVGLVMILAWYAILTVSFGGAVTLWLASGRPAVPGPPGFYAPFVYLHLTAVMTVHLVTLRRKMRLQRRSRRRP